MSSDTLFSRTYMTLMTADVKKAFPSAPTIWGIAARLFRPSPPVRSDHYRAFIREFPCVGCKTARRLRDAMHTGPHGLGQKASDLDCLPGCRLCHRELNKIGPRKFQAKHKIEFPDLIAMFQRFYAERYPDRVEKVEETPVQAKQEAAWEWNTISRWRLNRDPAYRNRRQGRG